MLTLAKLVRFQKKRNKSSYPSNMQFAFDAEECGFKLDELGEAQPFKIDGWKGYLWNVPLATGTVRMVEFGRTIHIEGQTLPRRTGGWYPQDAGTVEMFKLFDEKAILIEPEAAS